MLRVVLTYGTFDLFHVGHLRLLRRARSLGDKLIVGVSTDEFNQSKGKCSISSYADRAEIVASVDAVDTVIPEHSWGQKINDIAKYDVSIFCMGDDWLGKFDELRALCDVIYLPRTPLISSTSLKKTIASVGSTFLDRKQEKQSVPTPAI